jgi:CHAT domain-containing protein
MRVHAAFRRMPRSRFLQASCLAAAVLLASCSEPPPDAYVSGGASVDTSTTLAVGQNTTHEECGLQRTGSGGNVFCGKWTSQPSARIRSGGALGGGSIDALVTTSPWRAELDRRLVCDAPVTRSILDGQPARTLACRKRTNGFDVIALAAVVNGQAWLADGVANAVPAMERSIGVLSGRVSPEAASAQVSALAAAGTAAEALSAGDQASYDNLVRTATNANRLGQSASAESAWRDILRLQEKRHKPGAKAEDDPATTTALISLALQLSNEGRYAEADGYFERARKLVANSLDPNNTARFPHYEAIHLLNQHKPARALPLLQIAERRYSELAGIDLAPAGKSGESGGDDATSDSFAGQSCGLDPARCSALAGIVEVKRNESWAERLLGNATQSEADIVAAQRFALAHGLTQPRVQSYLLRTAGLAAMAADDPSDAEARFASAASAFDKVVPASLPGAQSLLRRAAEQLAAGDPGAALASCRQALEGLRRQNEGVEPALMKACLTAYAEGAGDDQGRVAEFFEAAQLVRDSKSREILQNAAARVSETADNPKAAEAARRLDDAKTQLDALNVQRGALEGSLDNPGVADKAAALDKQIEALEKTRAEAAEDVQSASPNYGQLVEPVMPLAKVYAVLRPNEALALIRVVDTDAWTVLLRDGRATISKVAIGHAGLDELVKRFRAGVEADPPASKPFDMKAAAGLYTALFGNQTAMLDGATSLVVVASGALLQVPFGALLTGPWAMKGDTPDYGAAPWLLRRMVIAHATSTPSFVLLRQKALDATAAKLADIRPWIGFGDFRPVTLAEARHRFPVATCGDDAVRFAELPKLPETKLELDRARKFTGAADSDEILGDAFTANAVLHMPLKNYRVIHFATHALLPTDLKCLSEPAIVTSPPAGATDAGAALLPASAVQAMHLDDADLVLLSACNTGGPSGEAAAEALDGLARSFFYAGARDMVITHWDTDTNVAAAVIALMLKDTSAEGPAAALRKYQLRVIETSAKGDGAVTHPFFWAPFALIGQGAASGGGKARVAAK